MLMLLMRVLMKSQIGKWFKLIVHNYQIGVCNIYRLRYYRKCCFNYVQFENIEYFAKTQLTPTLQSARIH